MIIRLVLALLLTLSAIPVARAADVTRTLNIGGLQRSYIVHTPPSMATGKRLPLVVVLHGGGGNGEITAKQTRFSEEADRSGFIAVYPNGTDQARPLLNAMGKAGLLTWNAGACCGYAMDHKIDDVAFIRAMIAQLERDYAIDPRRVYATGISNGGMMAYRLACEMSDSFAAIGPVAAVQIAPACKPAQPVAVIHFHGTADQNVPMAGGIGAKALEKDSRPPVQSTIDFWVSRDGCNAQPNVSIGGKVTLLDYAGCEAGSEVAFYVIDGGGHSWPAGDWLAKFLDPPSPDINATAVMWQFFAEHPKR
jgi:polyhydroxybutyrate depolymerase